LTREEFVTMVDGKLKLIRNEKGFTQDKMAEILGISKKTLIQIEKGRSSLGWTGTVAVCSLFGDSEILQMMLGGEPQDLVLSLAFTNYEVNYKTTLGGRVWWRDLESEAGYKIQQNIITGHFRLLDRKNRRIYSSFDQEEIKKRFNELLEGEEK
jgi:DNA-binding XRE family transcriptional regulator